jgi:hypothetical protein
MFWTVFLKTIICTFSFRITYYTFDNYDEMTSSYHVHVFNVDILVLYARYINPYLVFKGPLCLRNTVLFSSKTYFYYRFTVSKNILFCHKDVFVSFVSLATFIIEVNMFFCMEVNILHCLHFATFSTNCCTFTLHSLHFKHLTQS